MSTDNPPEEFELEYVDAYDCRAAICTGVILSGPGDGGFFQLATYADVQRIKGETLSRTEVADNFATYSRKNVVRSEPYREIQARILLSKKTLEALRGLIDRTLKQAEELAEKADVRPE